MSAAWDWVLEPLRFDFMVRALWTAIIAGAVGAVLSCWMTLIGWSLLGDAVSHSVLPGVVLAYIVGVPFGVGAFVFGTGAVAAIGVVRRTSRVKEDAAMGVVFTGLFALGIVLVSRTPSDVDLFGILFGNLLGISDGDLAQVVVLGAIVLGVVAVKHRDLTHFAFDRTHAHSLGISPRRTEVMLLGLLALSVVVTLQAVGIVLVVAMLIIPGATAYLLADRMERLLVIAVAMSVATSVIGVYLSYHADLAVGGTIVVCQALVFLAAYLRSVLRGAGVSRRAGRRRRPGSAPTPRGR